MLGTKHLDSQPGPEPRPNPLQKINHVARQLASVLRGRIPFLHNIPAMQARFVHAIVLMSDADVKLRILDPRVGNQVVRLGGGSRTNFPDSIRRLNK